VLPTVIFLKYDLVSSKAVETISQTIALEFNEFGSGLKQVRIVVIIRRAQMETFRTDATKRFEDEMIAHTEEFSPQLCEVLGEQQLRIAIRQDIEKANLYRFSTKGPIRLYTELTFLFGSHFDTDPQYTTAGEILRSPGDQMLRAQDLHEWADDYLDVVSGPENANVNRALHELHSLSQRTLNISSDIRSTLLNEVSRIYPEKFDYLGDNRVKELINEGLSVAQHHDFIEPRHQTLIVCLMFAFGHGCMNDALYPWISRTLLDQRIVGVTARVERLERKALTWLEHVLARQ